MTFQFFNSLHSEWLKTRRSMASWLVITGAFFIPVIILFVRFLNYKSLPSVYQSVSFWQNHFFKCWQIMAFLLLPLGVILASSLITQLEFRNNSWKQLHATPQYFSTIFFAKLAVIVLMMLQFFVLFNLGIYLSGIIPSLFLKAVAYPVQPFPFSFFLKNNADFFVDCLPIIAIQYLVSLQFKNFLLPLGFGIGLLVAATIAVQWKYGYIIPYTYCTYNYFQVRGGDAKFISTVNIHLLAWIYFAVAIIAGYFLYMMKKDKC